MTIMPSFLLPISSKVYDPDPDGPIRRSLRVALSGGVRTRFGEFTYFRDFRLDTGATYTLMSATLARSRGIPIPETTSRLPSLTAAGRRETTVRDGELRVRFDALPGHLFRLYCVFSEDVPPSVPPLLGLNDFADVFRFTVDGTPTPAAVFGAVHFDTR